MKNHNLVWYAGSAILLYLGVAYTGGAKLLTAGTSGGSNLIAAFQGRAVNTATPTGA